MTQSAGFKLQVSPRILRAVSRFAAVKDIRYYLNGVHFDVYPRVAYIVATCGHTMAVARVLAPDGETFCASPCSAIIPAEHFAKMKGGRSVTLNVLVELTKTAPEDFGAFTVRDFNAKGATINGAAIDGKFPDYRRVIPAETSGEAGNFNPEYLMRVKKAAEDLGSRAGNFDWHQGGPRSSALAIVRGDFLAVIMPIRGADSAGKSPEWVREDPANAGRTLDPEAAHVEALAEALEMAWGEALEEYAARELNDGAGPIAYVSPEIADAFGMHGIPNVRVLPSPERLAA